jgi:hypothetical protein
MTKERQTNKKHSFTISPREAREFLPTTSALGNLRAQM